MMTSPPDAPALRPDEPAGRGLGRCNPAARIACGLGVTLAALILTDPAALGLLAGAALLLILATRTLSPAGLLRILLPYAALAIGFGWTHVLLAAEGVEDPWLRAGTVALRTFVFGLWSIVAVAGVDAEDLAAALERYARLPPRIAFAAAGVARMAEGLRRDHRRMRGWRQGPRGIGVLDPRRALGFVQDALRRADTLAVALESRGLGGRAPRAGWRRSPLRGRDAVLAGGVLALLALALLVARLPR